MKHKQKYLTVMVALLAFSAVPASAQGVEVCEAEMQALLLANAGAGTGDSLDRPLTRLRAEQLFELDSRHGIHGELHEVKKYFEIKLPEHLRNFESLRSKALA